MSTVTSIVGGYTALVVSAAGAETDITTDYSIGVPTPATTVLAPKNLLTYFGGGKHTYSTNIELICYATCGEEDDCTMSIYGISDGGPPEYMGSLAWTFGAAVVSTGILWADSCTATSKHTSTFTAHDDAGDRVAKVNIATTGYKYLYAIVHTQTGDPTAITVLMRPF